MRTIFFGFLLLAMSVPAFAAELTIKGELTAGVDSDYEISGRLVDANSPEVKVQFQSLIQGNETECVVAVGTWGIQTTFDGITEHILFANEVKPCGN